MKAISSILYVEDDAHSRDILATLLSDVMSVPHVTLFADSSNFTARLEAIQPPPDLILLDIHVKPHNGFEMLNAIRAVPHLATIPVIALTASVMSEEVKRLKLAGFNGVIPKPVDIDSFQQVVERVLHGEQVWHILA
ncbi:MAG: response regulator [Anaerolineae bacterium]